MAIDRYADWLMTKTEQKYSHPGCHNIYKRAIKETALEFILDPYGVPNFCPRLI